ncbi:MAG: hypothetical protein V4694_02460 [Pseudomonadota bacterium]
MTESLDAKNQENKNIVTKKRQSFLTKLIILISLILFGYFGFKYWQVKAAQKQAAKSLVEKYDNIDSEIFDLSPDHEGADPHGLPDLTVNELKEKGAEFIYQMLLKNQVQITDLREQILVLKNDVQKYKNQERIGKLIFTYVDLRQKISAGKPSAEEFKNFEMLASFDENLQAKIAQLKPLLPNLQGREKLSKTFATLIPELVAAKNFNPDGGILSKIRYNISKLIIIRRIDDKNPGDVDSSITKVERLLREENYQEALTSLLSLDANYHEILKEFLDELSVSAEAQKIDGDILNYLKSLT